LFLDVITTFSTGSPVCAPAVITEVGKNRSKSKYFIIGYILLFHEINIRSVQTITALAKITTNWQFLDINPKKHVIEFLASSGYHAI
jgi:hypothetical protein